MAIPTLGIVRAPTKAVANDEYKNERRESIGTSAHPREIYSDFKNSTRSAFCSSVSPSEKCML